MARFFNFLKEKFKEGVCATKICDSLVTFPSSGGGGRDLDVSIGQIKRPHLPFTQKAEVASLCGGFLPRTTIVYLDSFFPLPWVVKGSTYLSGNRFCPCWLATCYTFWVQSVRSPGWANATLMIYLLPSQKHLTLFSLVFHVVTQSVSYLASFHSSGSLQNRVQAPRGKCKKLHWSARGKY